ncbi:polysaccharide biosynthesis protein [Flavobacterium ardleyense]|uniref:Polysaccharide biosynthesis protein n=1 Tax=Flavobacterium ardleyense TaxID=2038737 RepID=A0ABW5Z5A8_9FLAO
MSSKTSKASHNYSKSYSFLKDLVLNLNYLPRWIIFFIDIFIVILANAITYILLTYLETTFYNFLGLVERYSLIILVNTCFFIYFKTYSGIIRHSSSIDAIKLLFSTTSSLLVLIAINYSSYFIFDKKIYLFPSLIISYLFSFAFLFFFRVIIKFAYESFQTSIVTKDTIPTIIYGSDANAIAVANAIKSENPSRFRIVAFMDKSQSNTAKRILGLPIIGASKRTAVVLRGYKIKAVIIAEKTLLKEEKIALVEECLQNNIKVFTLPVVTNWENQKELSKQIKSFEINDLLERKPIVLDNKLVSSELSAKTVLITGAAGSIGSEIVRQVMGFNPKKLILLDQAETPLCDISLEIKNSKKSTKVFTIIADIRNKLVVENVFKTHFPDIVFHAAAYKHVPLMEDNPSQAIQTNVLGTKNIADLALQYKAKKFVMVSTDKAVNPSNVMGASKRIAEKYVQSLHYKHSKENQGFTKFITTRFGNVLGSNGSVVPLFKKQIEAGGPLTITHPDIIRYFMTIPEACQLVLEAGGMGNGGEIYIFDMGKPVKIIDLAKKMILLAKNDSGPSIEIKIIGLRPGEKLYEELLTDSSKTLPTHHEKIMIAQEKEEDYDQVLNAINDLAQLQEGDLKLVQRMKEIVPEYISLNSIFEHLDK